LQRKKKKTKPDTNRQTQGGGDINPDDRRGEGRMGESILKSGIKREGESGFDKKEKQGGGTTQDRLKLNIDWRVREGGGKRDKRKTERGSSLGER